MKMAGLPAWRVRPAGTAKELFWFVSIFAVLSAAHLSRPATAADDCAGRIASWDFHGQSVPPPQQQRFKDKFCREIRNVERWNAQQHWPAPPSLPRLRIFVSPEFHLAMSLVYLWEGDAGRMEFPADRVVAVQANVAHELTHIYLPNGNRMLAEGFASYVQDQIGTNVGYPNFGKDVNRFIRCEMSPDDRRNINLPRLDQIATPDLLTIGVGLPASQRAYYISSSFVRYLIGTHGMRKFGLLYARTTFQPGRRVGRTSDDWTNIYRLSIGDLEQRWKSMIEAVNCS